MHGKYWNSTRAITRIETLDTGNYLIGPEHAIERKRGDDLTASICDGKFCASANSSGNMHIP